MGEKQKVDVRRRHREPVERHLRVMALGNAAVHQDIDATAVVRLKLNQVAGAGDAGFSAQMGEMVMGLGVISSVDGCWFLYRAYITVGPDSVQIRKRQFQF